MKSFVRYIPKKAFAPVHYKFEWAVKDDYSSVDMGQFEGRDGRHTKGFYYVLLPDGRRQIIVL